MEVRGPLDGQEESSGSNGPPPPLVTRSRLSFILDSLLYHPLSFLRPPFVRVFDNKMAFLYHEEKFLSHLTLRFVINDGL